MPSRFTRISPAARVRSNDIPASPPPEVLDAIAAAHAAYERLEASGRRVHFDLDEATGRLAVELTDTTGTRLQSLSPRMVLELAADAPLY